LCCEDVVDGAVVYRLFIRVLFTSTSARWFSSLSIWILPAMAGLVIPSICHPPQGTTSVRWVGAPGSPLAREDTPSREIQWRDATSCRELAGEIRFQARRGCAAPEPRGKRRWRTHRWPQSPRGSPWASARWRTGRPRRSTHRRTEAHPPPATHRFEVSEHSRLDLRIVHAACLMHRVGGTYGQGGVRRHHTSQVRSHARTTDERGVACSRCVVGLVIANRMRRVRHEATENSS
jgi:hypothetical protein